MKFDYLANQVEDEQLRDLLIKSRKVNSQGKTTVYPVTYQGRTYWNVGQAINEEKARTSDHTILKLGAIMVGTQITLIFLLYLSARFLGLE
tara:strand:+ start:208 stop:480 length:273 start_codon:yes stop_codon:yes gene_type:complete